MIYAVFTDYTHDKVKSVLLGSVSLIDLKQLESLMVLSSVVW